MGATYCVSDIINTSIYYNHTFSGISYMLVCLTYSVFMCTEMFYIYTVSLFHLFMFYPLYDFFPVFIYSRCQD